MTLKEWRMKTRKTQAQVAQMLGCDVGTVSRWESGVMPEGSRMMKIHTATNGAVQVKDWLKKEGGK